MSYGSISAQSKLSARVIDNLTSTGVPYAIIQNLATEENSVSNENGQFQLKS